MGSCDYLLSTERSRQLTGKDNPVNSGLSSWPSLAEDKWPSVVNSFDLIISLLVQVSLNVGARFSTGLSKDPMMLLKWTQSCNTSMNFIMFLVLSAT